MWCVVRGGWGLLSLSHARTRSLASGLGQWATRRRGAVVVEVEEEVVVVTVV